MVQALTYFLIYQTTQWNGIYQVKGLFDAVIAPSILAVKKDPKPDEQLNNSSAGEELNSQTVKNI